MTARRTRKFLRRSLWSPEVNTATRINLPHDDRALLHSALARAARWRQEASDNIVCYWRPSTVSARPWSILQAHRCLAFAHRLQHSAAYWQPIPPDNRNRP